MKFLFLTPGIHVGGVDRWFATLARHVRHVRPHAVVVTSGGFHPQMLAEISSICPVYIENGTLEEKRLAVHREARSCDVLLTWPFQGQLGELTSGLDLPIVLTSHGSEELMQPTSNNVRFATHYTAVSRSAVGAFPAHLQDKVEVIYNGSDLERSAPTPGARERVRNEMGIGDKTLVLFIGRMVDDKRPDLVMSAVAHLGESYAAAFCGWGPKAPKICEMARRVKNDVIVADLATEPRDLLAACDVLALPSRHEGFAMVVLEAWLARRPVVVTPFKTSLEIQENHGDVMFISDNMHTPGAFAQAIRRAAMDDGTVVQRAWETAWEHYTATAMAHRWDQYLLRVIQQYHADRRSGCRLLRIEKQKPAESKEEALA